jgi:hypothetical protein
VRTYSGDETEWQRSQCVVDVVLVRTLWMDTVVLSFSLEFFFAPRFLFVVLWMLWSFEPCGWTVSFCLSAWTFLLFFVGFPQICVVLYFCGCCGRLNLVDGQFCFVFQLGLFCCFWLFLPRFCFFIQAALHLVVVLSSFCLLICLCVC